MAVSDVVERTAKALSDKYGAAMYTDYRQLLERKDIQAVCLCVPSGMRMEIAVACAEAGKNVLSEKPLDVSTKRIDSIIAATDKAGVRLGCIFQSRFADGSALIKQALDQGRFGTLVLGDAYIKWYRSPEYYASGAWRGTKKLDGGGALMNQGIHQIDLLQWFMGPVKTVKAQVTRRLHHGLEVEDTATAMLEFENGAFGVIAGLGTRAGGDSRQHGQHLHGRRGIALALAKRRAVDARIEAQSAWSGWVPARPTRSAASRPRGIAASADFIQAIQRAAHRVSTDAIAMPLRSLNLQVGKSEKRSSQR